MGTPVTLTRAEVPIGDHTGRKQMIFRVAAETTSDKPGLIVYEAVSNAGAITRYYTWFDSTGAFRYHTSVPTDQDADGSTVVSSSAGIVDINSTINHSGIYVNDGTPQTLTGAGAVNITTAITWLVTTAADALTLANGVEGQHKYIVMKTDGGDGTLTPTSPAGFATITFNSVGDSVHLLFTNGGWHLVGYNGVAIA